MVIESLRRLWQGPARFLRPVLQLTPRHSPGFQFLTPGPLQDGDLTLILAETSPAAGARVPTYHFRMTRTGDWKEMGTIDLRVGYTPDILTYVGQIGYRVHKVFRGHRYAARACRLLFDLARQHGMEELWITCDPDNTPSRRTLEAIGGELIVTVAVPKSHPYHQMGSTAKCRYLVRL